MKHLMYSLTFLLLLGASLPTMAQLSIGLRAAANVSNVDSEFDDESEETDNRFGFALGLIAEMGINDMFAIQPEILYSQHGFKINDSETYMDFGDTYRESYEGMLRHNYLQIPVLAKVKLGSDRFAFNILAGPHIGFGIGKVESDYEATLYINDVLEDQFSDVSKESWEDTGFKTFDFGITGGVGISIPAGPGTLGVDARYQLGLSDFSDDSDNSIMNRNIQLGLSYMLPLGM